MAKWYRQFFQIAYFLMLSNVSYLSYINPPFLTYTVYLSLLWTISPLFYLRLKDFILLLATAFLFTIGLFLFLPHSNGGETYLSILGMCIPCTFFIFWVGSIYARKIKFLSDVLEHVGAIIVITNLEGNIYFISDNVQAILGYAKNELLGKAWWDTQQRKVVSAEDVEKKIKSLAQSVLSPDGYNNLWYHKNGSHVWMHWNNTRLPNGHIIGVGQRVNVNKQMEEELSILKTVAKATPNLVLLADENFQIVWANEVFEHTTGFLHDELVNTPLGRFFNVHDFSTQLTESPVLETEAKIETRDKKIVYVSLLVSRVESEKETFHYVLIAKNNTDEKEKSRLKDLRDVRKESIHALSNEMTKAETFETFFSSIVKHVRVLDTGIKRVSLSNFYHDEGLVSVVFSNTCNEADIDYFDYPIKDSKESISVLKSASYFINNIKNEKQSFLTATQRMLNADFGIGCYICFPIKAGEELVGSINFAAEDEKVFTEETILFLQELSVQISHAVYQYNLKESIEIKSRHLEEKNKHLTDSIQYAKRIQNVVFPSQGELVNAFSDAFVYLQPKDNLSGDFYWMEETENELWIACVDCTGHGVPGALVSLVGVNILNQAVFENKFTYPNEVLAFLNKNIVRTLQNAEEKVSDAMDIALCCIHKKTNTLYYAGVMNYMVLISERKMHEFNPVRVPIGMDDTREKTDFEMHEVKYKRGDKFYIFSDGYADQFGGEKEKKYGSKNFKKLILNIADYPMVEQQRVLTNSHLIWKRDNEQTDDILVIGFEPKIYL